MNTGILQDSQHYDLSNSEDYMIWRKNKLAHYPATANDLLINIENINLLSESEFKEIKQCLNKFNMVIYSLINPSKITAQELCHFTKQFGLVNIDGNLCSGAENVSTVTVIDEGRNKGYIPYTNKPISWHSDGYYNSVTKTIRSFVLHCTQSAEIGGENNLYDPEIIYILLRDENPEYIRALMQDDVLTIPANIENGITIREQQTGPVFSFNRLSGNSSSGNNSSGQLQMRYTARTRSIEWKDTVIVQQAVSAIKNILQNRTEFSFQCKLKPGQGLLCNNILHNRTAFEQDNNVANTSVSKRELLRARYYDRIQS